MRRRAPATACCVRASCSRRASRGSRRRPRASRATRSRCRRRRCGVRPSGVDDARASGNSAFSPGDHAHMTTDAEAKELVVQITNEMFQLGLLTATGGNVSAKSSDGETIWITPSRLYKGNLREEDLVRIRADGSVVEGERQPSVEWQMHFS